MIGQQLLLATKPQLSSCRCGKRNQSHMCSLGYGQQDAWHVHVSSALAADILMPMLPYDSQMLYSSLQSFPLTKIMTILGGSGPMQVCRRVVDQIESSH